MQKNVVMLCLQKFEMNFEPNIAGIFIFVKI